MKKAISIGEEGRYTCAPNPWVGCIIVNNGCIVGQGTHIKAGESHAEIIALKMAGERSAGADLYVSLEPCAHNGKTTPCVDALIRAGIKRAFVAIEDPDIRVAGRGLKALKEAGIEVVLGICKKEAKASLMAYLHHRTTGLPLVILKQAVCIDGYIAAKDNSSKWITSAPARKDVHAMRRQSQAIIVGSGTVLCDNPSLTARDGKGVPFKDQPTRVVLDTRGRLTDEFQVFDTSLAKTIYFTINASDVLINKLQALGVHVIVASQDHTHPSIALDFVLRELAKLGVLQVIIEGGVELSSYVISRGMVDILSVYKGACMLGGGIPMFKNALSNSIKDKIAYKLLKVKKLGDDVRLDFSRV